MENISLVGDFEDARPLEGLHSDPAMVYVQATSADANLHL